MAKFNAKAEVKGPKTVNKCGAPAYKQGDEERLVSAVLTSFLGEPKFYGSTDNEIIKLAVAIAKKDPKFISNLAIYARREFNLRSVSHVLTAVLAWVCKGGEHTKLIRETIPKVVARPDDMTEIMSFYLANFGKPVPNSLKKGMSDALNRVGEYGLSKYKGNQNALKMKDLVKLVHPVPKDDKQSDLYKRLLNDELETPKTWEVLMSEDNSKSKKEKWEEIIDEWTGKK